MSRRTGPRVLRWLFVVTIVGSWIPVAVASSGTPVAGDLESLPPAFTSTPGTSLPERQPPTVTTTIVPLTPDVESTATDHVATRATPAAELPAETAAITATWTATGTATAPATATLNDLTIRIESADFSFGRIDASGAISSAPPGMSTTSFENGAYFMAPAAVTVVVDGDGPWEVTCGAVGENGLSRRLIGDGRIEWRLTDADWNAFGPPPDLPICFQEPQGGQKTLVLDIRLFVASSDPPGPFLATLVFAATGRG